MLDSIDEIISQALQDRHCKISHRLDLIRYYKRWNNMYPKLTIDIRNQSEAKIK